MKNWKDDIEKYKSGKMTPTEMHALEKRALSDPFLSDALEGVEEISSDAFLRDIEELNTKIAGNKNRRWLWPLRIAASVAGLAIVASIIIYSQQDSTENLASNKVNQETTSPKADSSEVTSSTTSDSVDVKSIEPTSETDSNESFIAAVKEEKKEIKEEPVKPKETKQSGSGAVSTSKPVIAETVVAGITVTDTISNSLATTQAAPFSLSQSEEVLDEAPVVQPAPPARKEASVSRALATTPLMIKGVVRDQQGKPIPGVNIVAKGSTLGAVTDVDGKYSIEVPDKDQTLVYSFIGFVSQEQNLNKVSADKLNVDLEEDITQLSEVVVTGYGEKRDGAEPVVRLAEPVGGRKAYDEYLEESKVYPQVAIDNKIEGKVIIEFTVGTSGILSDFKVIRKLGYGCDEEVIRLVKDGAAWSPSYIDNEAVESLVRIKTRFSLPKKK